MIKSEIRSAVQQAIQYVQPDGSIARDHPKAKRDHSRIEGDKLAATCHDNPQLGDIVGATEKSRRNCSKLRAEEETFEEDSVALDEDFHELYCFDQDVSFTPATLEREMDVERECRSFERDESEVTFDRRRAWPTLHSSLLGRPHAASASVSDSSFSSVRTSHSTSTDDSRSWHPAREAYRRRMVLRGRIAESGSSILNSSTSYCAASGSSGVTKSTVSEMSRTQSVSSSRDDRCEPGSVTGSEADAVGLLESINRSLQSSGSYSSTASSYDGVDRDMLSISSTDSSVRRISPSQMKMPLLKMRGNSSSPKTPWR